MHSAEAKQFHGVVNHLPPYILLRGDTGEARDINAAIAPFYGRSVKFQVWGDEIAPIFQASGVVQFRNSDRIVNNFYIQHPNWKQATLLQALPRNSERHIEISVLDDMFTISGDITWQSMRPKLSRQDLGEILSPYHQRKVVLYSQIVFKRNTLVQEHPLQFHNKAFDLMLKTVHDTPISQQTLNQVLNEYPHSSELFDFLSALHAHTAHTPSSLTLTIQRLDVVH